MTDTEVEFRRVDTDVTNLMDDAGVVDSRLYEIPETTLTLGYHINDEPITVTANYVAAIAVDREYSDMERAQSGAEDGDRLVFTSVLLAAEDGTAAEETIVNVRGTKDVMDALEAFEDVYEDSHIDLEESLNKQFVVEDGELVDKTVESEDDD